MDGVIVEKYIWQGLTKLLAVYDGADNLIQRFKYADDRLPVSMTIKGETYYLVYDQVESLRTVDTAMGAAQVWGGGSTAALGSGLLLSGGAIASTAGLALTGWGGWEIGQGFNRLYESFSGQPLGADIYDWIQAFKQWRNSKPCE